MKEQQHNHLIPNYLERLAGMVETVTDAAERLGVTRTRVQQLIQEEKLEAVKVGRGKGAQIWVSSLSIQERLDRQRRTRTTSPRIIPPRIIPPRNTPTRRGTAV